MKKKRKPEDRNLRVKEVAFRMGCTEETVRRWYREGKLPGAVKIGGPTSPIIISERRLRLIMKKRRGGR